MKKEGRLHVKKTIDKDTEDEIVAMAQDHKNAMEISNELGIDLDSVNKIIKLNF